MSPTQKRLRTIPHIAKMAGTTERTIRNYISKGYFPVYKQQGVRGVLIDLDEFESAMSRLPARKARAGYGGYGPNARVVTLPGQPVRAEVVQRDGEKR